MEPSCWSNNQAVLVAHAKSSKKWSSCWEFNYCSSICMVRLANRGLMTALSKLSKILLATSSTKLSGDCSDGESPSLVFLISPSSHLRRGVMQAGGTGVKWEKLDLGYRRNSVRRKQIGRPGKRKGERNKRQTTGREDAAVSER